MLPTGNSDAMMPESSTLIWATDEPKIAGTMRRNARRTPSCCGRQRGFGSARIDARNGNWKSSCTTPATNTAYASAMIGCSSSGATQTAAAISTTLSNTGVNAGTPKRPWSAVEGEFEATAGAARS